MNPTLKPTPGQTVGPFFGFALPYEQGPELVTAGVAGAIRLYGTIRDGAGTPIPDALLEIWQPDADGNIIERPGSLQRDGWTFTGFGRAATARDGSYNFTTIEPGPTAAGAAPFIALTFFARGLLDCLFTRIYLPDHPALQNDPLLTALPPDRRQSMIAIRDDHGLRFDVCLQGEAETVWLAFA
ncbi:protocatechuate 3,4-dioxygenase subunit alpha [Microlunatus elymi]|uniref:Protocatechuate 3,4-dioxygenase subunit alpha n=1 Tax=Microlunatus elymi TaxID=2596828 RepID=A0A516Q5N4_9ACTN|nr:protocatechuate 3,4-dioxygenase subunit alpha [Microlunatus elymi]